MCDRPACTQSGTLSSASLASQSNAGSLKCFSSRYFTLTLALTNEPNQIQYFISLIIFISPLLKFTYSVLSCQDSCTVLPQSNGPALFFTHVHICDCPATFRILRVPLRSYQSLSNTSCRMLLHFLSSLQNFENMAGCSWEFE